jgi:hypothetical protein
LSRSRLSARKRLRRIERLAGLRRVLAARLRGVGSSAACAAAGLGYGIPQSL